MEEDIVYYGRYYFIGKGDGMVKDCAVGIGEIALVGVCIWIWEKGFDYEIIDSFEREGKDWGIWG